MLSAKLQDNDRARVFPLNDKSSPSGLPSLLGSQSARSIILSESAQEKLRPVAKKEDKKPDWLTLHAREALGMTLIGTSLHCFSCKPK